MNESSGQAKRVSFLMPYIDFCFMLIIIFVGMLAIAYFEPPGKTDVEVKRPATRTDLVGRREALPAGIERQNRGTGESTPQGLLHPLKSPSNQEPFIQDNADVRSLLAGEGAAGSRRPAHAGRPPARETRPRASDTAANNSSRSGQPEGRGAYPPAGAAVKATPPQQASASAQIKTQADVDKLLKEIERLKATQGAGPQGKGETNNLYLDLRGGK